MQEGEILGKLTPLQARGVPLPRPLAPGLLTRRRARARYLADMWSMCK